ncbi:MAG: FHA domain-containing protein [Pyrinomonadaceae bacterium]
MANAKLKFDGREIEIGEGITTLGRASDNVVSFISDSNISRYHADIEQRDGEFWLTDLGSSNGTTVNDERVENEKLLSDDDVILLGGSSKVEFSFEKKPEEKDEENENSANVGASSGAAASKEETEIAKDAKTTSKLPWILGVMGVVCGLAIICVVGVILFSYFSTSKKCEATAKIVKPDNQETIYKPTEIEAEAENADCVERAIFVINGVEFANATEQPYKATIDPKKFPELADGSVQAIKIVLEDAEGNKIEQPGDFALVLETREIATPTPTPEEIVENPTPTPKIEKGKKISLSEAQESAKKIVSQFPGSFKYNTSNPQFLQEVQKKTAELVSEGYFARAQKYKDVINVAFVQNENLDAPLGYILAMSRSQFKPQKQGANEGLWQMNGEFAAANSYTALCGTQTLSDASQECAAKAAALYLKSLVLTVFEGDIVYVVAAFGMTTQEAVIWKALLPADRTDFWNVIKNQKQRDEVARFFAAAIVAENPQRFGLKNDRPISQLYP